MLGLFRSIKTSLVIMTVAMGFFLAGSIYIPKNLKIFSEINDMPLFEWLSMNSEYLSKTYWIYVLIILMACLSVNMLVCVIDDLMKRFTFKTLVVRLSPHLVHMGVLLVLLGHLISGLTGYRRDVPLKAGDEYLIEGLRIKVLSVEFWDIKGEDQSRWRIHLSIEEKGEKRDFISEPARPVFYRLGIYARSAEPDGRVILGFVKDPGALWAVTGACVFVIGAGGLFWTRFRDAVM